MKKEISAIINEHLPAQVAGEMKTFIESLEGIRSDLQKAEDEVEKHLITIAAYRKQEAKYKVNEENERQNEERSKNLDEREKELKDREDHIQVELMEVGNAAMEANMKNMERLVDKVFGHPAVTVKTRVPVNSGEYNAQGQYGGGEILEDVETTTTEGKQ